MFLYMTYGAKRSNSRGRAILGSGKESTLSLKNSNLGSNLSLSMHAHTRDPDHTMFACYYQGTNICYDKAARFLLQKDFHVRRSAPHTKLILSRKNVESNPMNKPMD